MQMTIMLEAMRKAGLVSSNKAEATKREIDSGKSRETKQERHKQKTDRKQKHERWKRNAVLNRFGDIATFEIWEKTGRIPDNYLKRCALCGKRPFDSIEWRSPKGTLYTICGECFSAEAKHKKVAAR
jgi:hypothetical protein